MSKPTFLDWVGSNGTTEPPASKKATGWGSGEKPAFQYFNWLHKESDLWHKFLNALTLRDGAYNLGLSYSSSELKIVQANGNDLTTDEDETGYVVMDSITAGNKVVLDVNAATHLFEDATGSSDIIGEEFNTTAGIAHGDSRPFFLYVVNSDDTSSGKEFAFSPNPCAKVSPATANIGYHGNPASSPSDDNFFFMTSDDVTSTHDDKPCICIGSFTMTKDASDDWTVDALTSDDGIGKYQEGRIFDFPAGQRGADANYFHTSSGTPPTWATPANLVYRFKINYKTGIVHCIYTTTSAGNCTNGTGANAYDIVSPYDVDSDWRITSNSNVHGAGDYAANGATAGPDGLLMMKFTAGSLNVIRLDDYNDNQIDVNMFSSAGDDITMNFSYKAF